VLDVACGTGVVTRMAAERAGSTGTVAGLDVNPGMMAVARAETPSSLSIDWYEANAESMPLPDKGFDIVLCQMGLQFVPNKLAALREMRRVLVSGGRAYVTVPGPKPRLFAVMTNALAHHISPEAASFVDLVFSMNDAGELRELLRSAGFRDISVQSNSTSLSVPVPADFLWQYLYSTPLAEKISQLDEHTRDALEREVYVKWEEFVADGSMSFQVGMTTAIGTS
jgi:ubiquinone/menaquinone biosynthesis C-methylase UbiE